MSTLPTPGPVSPQFAPQAGDEPPTYTLVMERAWADCPGCQATTAGRVQTRNSDLALMFHCSGCCRRWVMAVPL